MSDDKGGRGDKVKMILLDKGGRGFAKKCYCMKRGWRGVHTTPKKGFIICEQPLDTRNFLCLALAYIGMLTKIKTFCGTLFSMKKY